MFGGGGGSGGRIVTHLLQNYNSTYVFNQSFDWNGTILLAGGVGGSYLHAKAGDG